MGLPTVPYIPWDSPVFWGLYTAYAFPGRQIIKYRIFYECWLKFQVTYWLYIGWVHKKDKKYWSQHQNFGLTPKLFWRIRFCNKLRNARMPIFPSYLLEIINTSNTESIQLYLWTTEVNEHGQMPG